MPPSCNSARRWPEELQRYLIIVTLDVVTEFGGVDDLEVLVERAVLRDGKFSQRIELIERNDLCDLEIPTGSVARRRGPTLLNQSRTSAP